MNNKNIQDLREKIIKGLELAFKRLVKTKSKNNEKLVFSENGKIVFVDAKKFLN